MSISEFDIFSEFSPFEDFFTMFLNSENTIPLEKGSIEADDVSECLTQIEYLCEEYKDRELLFKSVLMQSDFDVTESHRRINLFTSFLRESKFSKLPIISKFIDRLSRVYEVLYNHYNVHNNDQSEMDNAVLMLRWINVALNEMWLSLQSAQGHKNFGTGPFVADVVYGKRSLVIFKSTWKLIVLYMQLHPSIFKEFDIPMSEMSEFANTYIALLTGWTNSQ